MESLLRLTNIVTELVEEVREVKFFVQDSNVPIVQLGSQVAIQEKKILLITREIKEIYEHLAENDD